MKKVKYFIIGAPKSGTTSLRSILNEYFDTYIPSPVEPNYFCDDLTQNIKKFKYTSFFKKNKKKKILGEKSTWYLASKNAVKNIQRYNSEAKFIAIIRNPVDMFFSLHNLLCALNIENETDPEKAWKLSLNKKRKKKNFLLDYEYMCKTGSQLKYFKKKMHIKKNLMIVSFDDFISNQQITVFKIAKFLNLKLIKKYDKINVKENPSLNNFLMKISNFNNKIIKIRIVQSLIRIFLIKFNIIISKRENKNFTFKKKLYNYFSDEIKIISKIFDKISYE